MEDRRSPSLARWGRLVHRRRALVLVLGAAALAISVAGVLEGGDLANRLPEGTESARASELLLAELPGEAGASFTLVFRHPTLRANDTAFPAAVERALAPLRNDSRVATVDTPWSLPPPTRDAYVSADGRGVLAVVTTRESFDAASGYYAELRRAVAAPGFEVHATGGLAIHHDFEATLADDLVRAEVVALPLVVLLLLLVFGTATAAILPVGVGGLAVVGGVAAVFALSGVTNVATYAVNVVTLIGLGVAIDYSLFVVNRFREELPRAGSVENALAATLATAGRATLFSGLTVAVGLSGLLFFRGTFLASMGLGGAIVVALAVLYALTVLPALLSYLGPRVDALRLPGRFGSAGAGRGLWRRLARRVMRRPVAVLVPALVLLLSAGVPFLDIELATGDVRVLPADTESREGHERIVAHFPQAAQTRFVVVLAYPDAPLTPDRVGEIHDYSRALAALPGVLRVESVVDLDPRMTRADYVQVLTRPASEQPPEVQAAVRATVGPRVVALAALSAEAPSSDAARALLAEIRALAPPPGATSLVTGATAYDVDTIDLILARVPVAVTFVVLATVALLLVLSGSVLLPLKAVVMNLLSITASFGALVWVFQEGNFSSLLDFTPGPIEPALPVIMFCIVFGLSMDYEVLLLSRIKEEYDRHGDNERAVADGLEASGRLITGAALIMVLVFAAFALSGIVIVKSIGLGLALAVALDASIVRALVVPSLMRLLGDANWWAPRWLKRLHEAV